MRAVDHIELPPELVSALHCGVERLRCTDSESHNPRARDGDERAPFVIAEIPSRGLRDRLTEVDHVAGLADVYAADELTRVRENGRGRSYDRVTPIPCRRRERA